MEYSFQPFPLDLSFRQLLSVSGYIPPQRTVPVIVRVCHTRGLPGSENVSRVEGMKISAWLYAVIRIPGSHLSKTLINPVKTTLVGVITVHCLGGGMSLQDSPGC